MLQYLGTPIRQGETPCAMMLPETEAPCHGPPAKGPDHYCHTFARGLGPYDPDIVLVAIKLALRTSDCGSRPNSAGQRHQGIVPQSLERNTVEDPAQYTYTVRMLMISPH